MAVDLACSFAAVGCGFEDVFEVWKLEAMTEPIVPTCVLSAICCCVDSARRWENWAPDDVCEAETARTRKEGGRESKARNEDAGTRMADMPV